MDYLVACMTRPMWFNFGEWDGTPLTDAQKAQGYYIYAGFLRRVVQVRWYWAPEGAQEFPYVHCYGSSVWTSRYENGATLLGEVPLGWVSHVTGDRGDNLPLPKWNNGAVQLGATGRSFCGKPEWFDGPVPDGGMQRGPGGLPICCNPGLGAAMGLGPRTLPIAQGAAVGLRSFSVEAALAMSGAAPVIPSPRWDFGLGGPTLPTDAGVGLTSHEGAAVGPLALSYPHHPGEIVLGPAAAGLGLVFGRGDIGSDWSLLLGYLPGSEYQFAVSDGIASPFVDGTDKLSAPRWYHVAVRWNGLVMSQYVDANEDGSGPTTLVLRPSAGGITWGTFGGGVFGSGDWSEVRIYAAALTDAEILADMLGTVQAGITAQYHCDDGSGVTVTDSVGAADGTLINGPSWLADGPGGGAVRFDAALSQYGNFPDTIGNLPPCTITLWYRPPRA